MSGQKILMCAPDYFGVDYVINPWMEGNLGAADRILAYQQWANLKLELEKHAEIELVAPQPGLPDMVFTANAGMVLGRDVIVSRFRTPQRRGEEPFFEKWFAENGFQIAAWPKDVAFEGAGDALFDREQPIIWAASGFRTDPGAPLLVEKLLDRRVLAVRLVDPRFYHIDTCLCPLDGGILMYYPAAFDDESRSAIALTIPPEKRIEVSEEDAMQFSCNAVDLAGHVFMNAASDHLQARLRELHFTPTVTPLSEFLKAGGGAKCLTLKLFED